MKANELKSQRDDELLTQEGSLRKELFELRQQKSTSGKAEKPSRFRMVRKQIARIKTILNERKKQDGKKA